MNSSGCPLNLLLPMPSPRGLCLAGAPGQASGAILDYSIHTPLPVHEEIPLAPLSKHFRNLIVVPTSTWPPLQAPSPVPAFWLPCSPFPTMSSPARNQAVCPQLGWPPEQNHRLSKACKALQKLPPPRHRVCSSQLASMRYLQPLTGPTSSAWNVLPPATCRAPSQGSLTLVKCHLLHKATPITLFHVATYPPSPETLPLPLPFCRNTYHFLHKLYISFC